MDSLKEFVDSLTAKLGLRVLDDNESLPFVEKYTGLKPSFFAFWMIVITLLVILIADGSRFIASIVCFLLPACACIETLSVCEHAYGQARVGKHPENEQYLTDEENSRMLEKAETTKQELGEKYVVYFMLYTTVDIATPIMVLCLDSFAWMVFRIVLTLALLHPRINLVNAILVKIARIAWQNTDSRRREANLFKKVV